MYLFDVYMHTHTQTGVRYCTRLPPTHPLTLFPPPYPTSTHSAEARVAETPGKKALAMEAFARALRQLPTIIADNGGYDSSELITQLRAAHAR